MDFYKMTWVTRLGGFTDVLSKQCVRWAEEGSQWSLIQSPGVEAWFRHWVLTS
jgi:hypothetical protein